MSESARFGPTATNSAGMAVGCGVDGVSVRDAQSTSGEEAALAGLHRRCSLDTLFARYHTGASTLPASWIRRLLDPPNGRTVLVVTPEQIVGYGQLIADPGETTDEVSLLVEDAWQGRGIGTALLEVLIAHASHGGQHGVHGWCMPAHTGLRRTAQCAGYPTTSAAGTGLVKITIPIGDEYVGATDFSARAVPPSSGAPTS